MINYLLLYLYIYEKKMIHLMIMSFAIIYWSFGFIIDYLVSICRIILCSKQSQKSESKSLSPLFFRFSSPNYTKNTIPTQKTAEINVNRQHIPSVHQHQKIHQTHKQPVHQQHVQCQRYYELQHIHHQQRNCHDYYYNAYQQPQHQQFTTTQSPKQRTNAYFPGWNDNTYLCLNELNRNYIFGKEIGRGAYSSVFEAKHRFVGNKIFAIKRTKYRDNTERLRFIEENRIQSIYGGMTCYLCFDNNYMGSMEIISIWDCHYQTLNATLSILKLFDDNLQKKEQIVSKIMYKILIKLQHLHASHIIHHDLKPENILIHGNPISDDFDVFIIDYGFSVFFDEHEKEIKSEDKIMIPRYTLTYCAWELLDCINKKEVAYSSQIDMWALGVIAMELLLNGKNCIFNDRERNKFIKDKIDKIIKKRKIGEYEKMHFQKEYHRFLRGLKVKYHRQYFLDEHDVDQQKSTISSFVVDKLEKCGYSITALHFVAKLLDDDPNERMNANDALKHPFIAGRC